MATKWIAAAVILSFAASLAEAAPPSRSSRRPTTSRPAPKTNAPQPTTKPATTPAAKPTNPTFDPPPIPPQPKREEDAVEPKAAIPHPPVAEEVKATTTQPKAAPPVADAPGSLTTVAPDADGKYRLRYHFSNGETIRWQVEHRAKIVTSVQGSTQTAETVTLSTKVWRVVETTPGGETRFVHSVEAVDMRQKLTGRQEVTYNSATDKEVPPIFADAAKQVGVPLAEVTIDARGNVLKREDRTKRPEGAPTNTITVVLPDAPLAIGESWTAPLDLTATDAAGAVKTIKARHKLTLEKVEDGVALIRNETQILSPLDDPTVEAQLVQSEQTGQVSFDLRTGRIVAQHSELDKEVFGFQGPESKLHYTARFQEKLSTESATTADAAGAPASNPLR
jgi:hypothetical protein